MTDLRKYIIDPGARPFAKLIEEAYSRTKSDVLDEFETLACFDDEVKYTIGLHLKNNLLESVEQYDYAEWGKQKAKDETVYDMGINTLLYAIIMAAFDESMINIRVISGQTCDVVWNVTHPEDDDFYAAWQEDALSYIRDGYKEALAWRDENFDEYEDKYEDGTVGNIIIIRFSDECDQGAVSTLMDDILKDCFEEEGGCYLMDVVCHDPGYHESGLMCDFEQCAEKLIAFLREYGFPRRRKPGKRFTRVAQQIAEAVEEELPATKYIIQEIRNVRGSEEQIIL